VELPVQRVPPPAGALPAPEVVALLSPFMYPTPHAIANNMLFLYIKYHMVLGIRKYVQYTQARPLPCGAAGGRRTSCRAAPGLGPERGVTCVMHAVPGGGYRGRCEPGPACLAAVVRCVRISGCCAEVMVRARAQSTFIGGFMADARLATLVDKGVLEFVLWESTVECGKGARLKCWQPVLYSHAILAAWGTGPNLYYSFADHDEYLAMPYPNSIGTVQDIITMCSAGQTQARTRRPASEPAGHGTTVRFVSALSGEAELLTSGPRQGRHQ